MNHFCTLFDSGYLTRGLALYDSLERTGEPFRLYIFCFDDLSLELLRKLALKNAVLIPLSDFETPELLKIKPGRSRGEYCWTSASHTIRHVLDKFKVAEVTYLDSDVYFFQRPSALLDEFHQSGDSVLITEHRYAPEYDQSATSGRYCVQFMTFKNAARGREVLDWWCARCVEWCFNRFEDGKFGDQKYLDDWTTRFKGVHVLQHLGGGVAPWNIRNYTAGPGPSIDGTPVIFFHFHTLRWNVEGFFDMAEGYRLGNRAKKYVYEPYLEALKKAFGKVRQVRPDFTLGKVSSKKSWRDPLRKWKKLLNGSYNVVPE